MPFRSGIVLSGLLVFICATKAATNEMDSDKHVKQAVIKESIENYPGKCPCPYNTARNGSLCGNRSAWSRAGGYAPICYEKEVTKQMISDWKATHTK